MLLAGTHNEHLLPLFDATVKYPHERERPEVVVEPAVVDDRLGRGVFVSVRRRYALYDRIEQFTYPLARFGTHIYRPAAVEPYRLLYLFDYTVGVGGRQVYLVYDRNDFKIVFKRDIYIRYCLGLDSLRCVDHKQRPLGRGERLAYFIAEIDMARCVDKI